MYVQKRKAVTTISIAATKGRCDLDMNTQYAVEFQYPALSQGHKVGLGVQLLVAIAM